MLNPRKTTEVSHTAIPDKPSANLFFFFLLINYFQQERHALLAPLAGGDLEPCLCVSSMLIRVPAPGSV